VSAPVLVLGTGRCGSTLVSELVRTHPTVLSVSELFSFVTDLGLRIGRAFPAEPLTGSAFWEILAAPQPRQSLLLQHGLQMDEVIYPWGVGRFTAEAGVPPILQALLPHLAPDDPDALFDALRGPMCARGEAPVAEHFRAFFGWLQVRFGKRSWAERSGGSLRIAHRLLAAFPEAKVLHLVRDGRNTALSMSRHVGFRMALISAQQLEFLGVDPYESDDRSEEGDLTDDLAALLPERFSHAAFEAFDLPAVMCGHYWSGEIVEGIRALSALPTDRLLTLRYEDLLEQPASTIRRLGDWLDDETPQGWVDAAAARVRVGRSAWQQLPPAARAELDAACRPGFEALAALGLRWE
jgi:hypothetical protein